MKTTTAANSHFVFLHIPKTAGNTLHKVIKKQYRTNALFKIRGSRYLEDIQRFKELPDEQRAQIQALTGHMYFGLHEYLPGSARYITFLREPVDRVISLYYHILRHQNHRLHQVVAGQNMALADFVRCNVTTEINNDQVRYLSGVGHTIPSGECTASLFEQAKRNLLDHFAVVGLTERFDESLLLVAQHFGWKLPAYQSRNVADNRPKSEEISADVRAAIQEQNRFDAELYQWGSAKFKEAIARQGSDFQRQLNRLRARNRIFGRLTSLFRRQSQSR